MKSRFAHALRNLRTTLRMSQLDLAHRLGTTQRHVSFLETGRSQPTREMVGRIVTGLSLSVGQRTALFEACNYAPSTPTVDREAPEIRAALDLLQRRVLDVWPHPAYLLDPDWNILRANGAGQGLLALFGFDVLPSMYEVLLSPPFRALCANWEDFSMAFFFRLQAAAEGSSALAALLERARADGVFDHVADHVTRDRPAALVPAVLQTPNARLTLTSVVGGLVTAHDASVDALQVELIVPCDAETAQVLASMSDRPEARVTPGA